jgi:secreted protein with Ig-like and vWFA domain
MATITATSMTGSGAREVTVTTLGASDTFTYNAARSPVIILNNVTGGALTPNFDGDGGTTVPVAGGGAGLDVSSGYTTASIAAGESWAIPLSTIAKYLTGTIALTGGTGIEASILEF